LKFKLDENLPQRACQALAELGHSAHTVIDERLSGASDDALMRACAAEGRILVTLDLDFADMRVYPPGTHAGVWVLRPTTQTIEAITRLLVAALPLAATERVHGQLWVIDERRVRIRDAE
jgi:predicted nuclease of predicted toxin-antitoxin system